MQTESELRSDARRRRLLVCVPFTPRLDARHGGKATTQLLLRLAERSELALLCLRAADEDPVDPAVAAHCALVEEVRVRRGRMPRRLVWGIGVLRGLPPWASDCRSSEYRAALERVLDRWQPDLVEIHLLVMAQYVDAAARRDIPRILVDYDPGSAWAKELLGITGGPGRWIRRLELAAWRRYERSTRGRFDTIVVFAERDLAAVEPSAGRTPLVRIPLAVDVPPRPLDPVGTGPTVLFVGGFAHHPNVDAARWIAGAIFPRLLDRVPEARLDIVGHAPTDQIRRLGGGPVSVHASVPDVTPYVDRAAVVVAPIRIGGSMRMKVLEALAAGKALVATPRAAEGVAATPGRHFVLAQTEEEFVAALAELLRDRERRRALGTAARRWAEENLGWGRGVEEFERLYETLIEAKR
jgi:glycosyltransferase involved in cell wall biosynthesis